MTWPLNPLAPSGRSNHTILGSHLGVLRTSPDPKVFGWSQGIPNLSKVFQAVPSHFPEKKDCLFLAAPKAGLPHRSLDEGGLDWRPWLESTQIKPSQTKKQTKCKPMQTKKRNHPLLQVVKERRSGLKPSTYPFQSARGLARTCGAPKTLRPFGLGLYYCFPAHIT
jgi:hypothetical protein